jgi:hypothetical protein
MAGFIVCPLPLVKRFGLLITPKAGLNAAFLNSLPSAKRLAAFNPHPQKDKLLTVYNGEPTIPPVHYYHDDIDVSARFSYSLGGSFNI